MFLFAHYFIRSIEWYHQAKQRLQSLHVAQMAAERIWAHQQIPKAYHTDQYTITYKQRTYGIPSTSLPEKKTPFKLITVDVHWSNREKNRHFQMPIGFIPGKKDA